MMKQLEPVTVFLAYAHEDESLCKDLEKHLSLLQRQGLISTWHDQQITAGTDRAHEIDEHLNSASVILLLVSANFLHSDYCYSVEMKRALERHKLGEARVIPIILRPVDWEGAPIASLRNLPSGGKPITLWHNRDEALANISQGIRRVIQNQQKGYNESMSNPDYFPSQETEVTTEKTSSILSPNTLQIPHYETIDAHEAIALFQKLMLPDSNLHLLRLVGEGKTGKSHLLTKAFPSMIQQHDRIRYAVLDIRNRMYTVPDILHMACSLLNPKAFDHYYTAHLKWSDRLTGKARRSPSFDPNSITMGIGISEDIQARDRDLTTQFVRDLSQLDDKLVLFLFDSVDNTTEYIQIWLANTFLAHTSGLSQARAIIAGRSLPDIHGSYARYSESYQLRAITDLDEYILYCKKQNARLGEQSVRDFASACDYIPGMFVELIYPKFIK